MNLDQKFALLPGKGFTVAAVKYMVLPPPSQLPTNNTTQVYDLEAQPLLINNNKEEEEENLSPCSVLALTVIIVTVLAVILLARLLWFQPLPWKYFIIINIFTHIFLYKQDEITTNFKRR